MLMHVWDLPVAEIELRPTLASGPGGQHVNKVATAIHLNFGVNGSSLPAHVKERLLKLNDNRITRDGAIVIKANRYRSRERNKQDALERLDEMLVAAQTTQKARKKSRPTKASVRRRLDGKKHKGQRKDLRKPPDH